MKDSKLVEKKCPNCGAKLSFKLEDKEVKCNYCNSEFIIKDDNSDSEKIDLNKINLQKVGKFSLIFVFGIFFFIVCIWVMVVVFIINSGFNSRGSSKSNVNINNNDDEISIDINELNDDVKEELTSTCKSDLRSWNGHSRTYKMGDDISVVGFYYLKSSVSAQVVCVLSANYSNGSDTKTIYTSFKFFGSDINSLRNTSYIGSGTYHFSSYEIVYGYDNLKDLYKKEISNQRTLGFKMVSTEGVYSE